MQTPRRKKSAMVRLRSSCMKALRYFQPTFLPLRRRVSTLIFGVQKMSKIMLGLAEKVLAQPSEKTSCEGAAAALLLANVAWNRAVDPLGGDQIGHYRKVLRALKAEN